MTAGENLRTRYYRPELDVLRFYAFLLVFLSHSVAGFSHPRLTAELPTVGPILMRFTNAGRFGLTIFFVLSAFLLCELLLREKQSSGSIHVGQFYLRRIARIWPLYYLALALGMVYALRFASAVIWHQVGLYAIFMAPFCVTHLGYPSNPILPLWSISIEERFYVFIPWLINFSRRRTLLAIAVALIAVSYCRIYYLGSLRAPDSFIWVDSLVEAQSFAAGILISLLLRSRLPRFPNWMRPLIFLGGILCFYFATPGHDPGDVEEWYANSWTLIEAYLLANLGSAIALIALLGLPSNLVPRWGTYLGRISYGLYAFHLFVWEWTFNFLPNPGLPMIAFLAVRILVGLALTILVAAISFRFIETPFVELRKRHAVIASQPG